MIWIRGDGWPVVFTKGRPIVNLLQWFCQASIVESIRNVSGWHRSDGGLSMRSSNKKSGIGRACECVDTMCDNARQRAREGGA